MYILLRWLLSTLAILVAAFVVPGITIQGIYAALIFAVVLGLLNAVVRPVLVLLTFPVTVLTLGIFLFVINALLLWFASTIVKGVQVDGFGSAFMGAVVIWLVGWCSNVLLTRPSTVPVSGQKPLSSRDVIDI